MEIIAIVGETGPPQAFWPTPTIDSIISHGAMNQTAVKPTRTISSQRSVWIFWAYLVVVVMVLVVVVPMVVLNLTVLRVNGDPNYPASAYGLNKKVKSSSGEIHLGEEDVNNSTICPSEGKSLVESQLS
eukprot:bmy_03198T0